MKRRLLKRAILLIGLSVMFAPLARSVGALGGEADTSVDPAVAVTAADVARQLRDGTVDVTGNGVCDETDALAQLMGVTGAIADLSALPSILEDSLLGEKYLEKFSYTGIVSERGYYRSESISYTLTHVEDTKLSYYVADIYLRDIQHFRTGFPQSGYNHIQSVKKMAKYYNAIVAVNGDYYSAQDPVGIVARNGVFYHENTASRRDVCALFSDGTMKVYGAKEVDVDELYDAEALHVWQFGPALLNDDGTAKSGSKSFNSSLYGVNPRTVLGYYEPGHYCFVTVEGRGKEGSKGLNLSQLSELMASLGCAQAYNLDGGGSSVMADAEGVLNTPSSNRSCSDILYIVEDYASVPDAGDED